MPRTHRLKTWPSYYDALLSGAKTFEVRQNDRDFAVGDLLILQEYDPTRITVLPVGYAGREFHRRVTYLMPGGNFGIAPNFVVMGLGDSMAVPV